MPLVHLLLDSTGDLFDDGRSLLGEFAEAFDAWLASLREGGQFRHSSEGTYRDMWGTFVQWCLAQQPQVALQSLTAADLEAFVQSRHGAEHPGDDLSPRYTLHLLKLVDRVLAHHARHHGLAPITAVSALLSARPDLRYADARDAKALPEFLLASEAKQLVAYLSQARPRPGGRGAGLTWQDVRNRASVGLQLGAGLSPGDVRAVLVEGVASSGGRVPGVPWKIAVPADGNSPARETPIALWAGQLLRHWMDVRAELAIPGDWLFPSTRSGKPWGKVAQYLASKRVLLDAGLDDADGGSFRLRHTFALRQLRRRAHPDEVARWLGVTDPAVMARYLRVLTAPADVV